MITNVLAKMIISIDGILAYGPREFWLLIPLAVYVFIVALIIICLVRVSRYCKDAGKERKLVRIELGKLAEEVHLIRQELKGGKEQDSSQQ